MTPCPCCGAHNDPMGTLGRLTHYRCRDCGMTYSATADNNTNTNTNTNDDDAEYGEDAEDTD